MNIAGVSHYSNELRELTRNLNNHCKTFCEADNRTATIQLLTSLIPFLALVVLIFIVPPLSTWLGLALAIPTGAFLVRLFALQHDCGHGSFFTSKIANERVGQLISLLTFTPYDHWRRMHALHHSTSGNLDKRGYGDIETITVREYDSLTPIGKLRYRFFRNPLIALVIGPPVHFLILQRFAIGAQAKMKQVWKSLLLHNVALFAFYGGLCYFLGWSLVLQVVLPIVLVAAWIGGWLFFVQHQFEETLWDGADEWDLKIAALKGSSHLVLPAALNWFTCDIGLHHIHHLCSRIPNYRLRECMKASSDLQMIAPRLTLAQALLAFRFSLWDEATRTLISFRAHARQLRHMNQVSARG